MPIDFLNVPRPGPPREARETSLPDLLWSGVRSLPGIQYTPGPATPKTDPRSRFTGSSRLPTPSHHRPSETFWKVPSQTCGAPGASEPELYKTMNVRGRPPPPFLCRKIWETISYDQNYAELVESCPVSQLVSRAPAGVPLLPRCHGWCPGWSPGWSPGWTPLVSRFVSRLADCMNERMHK